jgi:hypothetical protein
VHIFIDRLLMTRNLAPYIITVGLIFSGTPQAFAQTDWMKMGQDLLGEKAKSTGHGSDINGTDLTTGEVATGLKDALRVGTETVVNQLGQDNGFNDDPIIHIPLPEQLETVRSALTPLGMAPMLDDLELKMNRAAEAATPKAKALFWQSIDQMTMDDVMGIYNGPDDAATRYFERTMSPPLGDEMRPVISESLDLVGAIQAYDAVMSEYQSLPFVPDVKADMTDYVTQKGMDGIFHYLAQEEASIRTDPVKRTTDILQKVFGAE